MKKLITGLATTLLLLLLPIAAHSQPELKGSPEELRHFLHLSQRTVSIQGQAEETAYADKAIISLVITTEDKLLSNSIANNTDLRESITQQLISAGINNSSIKSSKFSTSPQYGWFGDKPDSYEVINRMAISITQESQLKAIATVADTKDEIELLNNTFEHGQKEAYKSKVKKQALSKVMAQKALYESSLGVTLTPIGLRENRLQVRGTKGAEVLEEILVTASKSSRSYHDKSVDYLHVAAPKNAPASFDEIVYSAQIYVDFSVVPDNTD
jgi:uncharacterized protein